MKMQKQILVIPDVHGYDYFPIKGFTKYDKIIFLGDYWDSFDKSFSEQLDIFEKIILIKEHLGDKAILLWGNHDYHYYNTSGKHRCSGYQDSNAGVIHQYMKQHEKLFKFVHVEEVDKDTYFLFSHAGVTDTLLYEVTNNYDFDIPVYDFINENGHNIKELFYCSSVNGGRNPYDGLMWVRPNELLNDPIADGECWVQVVGHTFDNYPRIKFHNRNEDVLFIDSQKPIELWLGEDTK